MSDKKEKIFDCVAVEAYVRSPAAVDEKMPILGLMRDPEPGLKLLTYHVTDQLYVPTTLHEVVDGGRQAVFEIAVTRGQILRVTATQKVWTHRGWKEGQAILPQDDKVYVMIPGRDTPLLSKVMRNTPVGQATVAKVVLKSEPYTLFVNDILVACR